MSMETPNAREVVEKESLEKFVGTIPAGQEWVVKNLSRSVITISSGAKLVVTESASRNVFNKEEGGEIQITGEDSRNTIEEKSIDEVPAEEVNRAQVEVITKPNEQEKLQLEITPGNIELMRSVLQVMKSFETNLKNPDINALFKNGLINQKGAQDFLMGRKKIMDDLLLNMLGWGDDQKKDLTDLQRRGDNLDGKSKLELLIEEAERKQ